MFLQQGLANSRCSTHVWNNDLRSEWVLSVHTGPRIPLRPGPPPGADHGLARWGNVCTHSGDMMHWCIHSHHLGKPGWGSSLYKVQAVPHISLWSCQPSPSPPGELTLWAPRQNIPACCFSSADFLPVLLRPAPLGFCLPGWGQASHTQQPPPPPAGLSKAGLCWLPHMPVWSSSPPLAFSS